MNPADFLAAPVTVILLKWTALLVLAWSAQWLLIRRHARWRLILWRCVLGFGLILPLSQFVELPGIRIPIPASTVRLSDAVPFVAPVAANNSVLATIPQPATALSSAKNSSTENNNPPAPPTMPFPWARALAAVWIIGFVLGALRLLYLQLALTRLRRRAGQPTTEIKNLAHQVQMNLNMQRAVEVRLSDAITSPFVFGVLRPTVMLPQALAQQLAPGELTGLLNHELAHVRQHDLLWSVAWQWMRVACWFHPLVWNAPAAHGLACEQEADRIASGQMTDQSSYAQLLARLALRVLALPVVETRLTVNGSSEIAKRLKLLGQNGRLIWNWWHSVTAICLTGVIFLMVAGCKTGTSVSTVSTVPASPSEMVFKKVLVVVQDEDGKPVHGATIKPEGFRVKGIHGADAYGWNTKLFGPPETVMTDSEGKAYVRYPVEGIPEEKEYTGKIYFSVSHPDYCTVRPQEYSVDSPEQPIRMTRGIPLRISAYYGSDHQPVPELAFNLNEEVIHAEDWRKCDDGTWLYNKLTPGEHLIQAMGRMPSGEIVFSESRAFTAKKNGMILYLEMKPGIRLEGRLDDSVPRPVKNGRVLISVRPKEFPAWTNWNAVDAIFKKYPNVQFWKSYRPIAADGTFVFESVPPGGLDVIVHGDGFASKNGGFYAHNFGVPQVFALEPPTTRIEVVTEPTATLELTAKNKRGEPVEGATIWLNPNVIRINGIFGDMKRSSEEPFRKLDPLPDVPYKAITDKEGVAIIRNVPACTGGMEIDDPRYQVPIQQPKGWRDRHVRVSFEAGVTTNMVMTLEPKSADYIGTTR